MKSSILLLVSVFVLSYASFGQTTTESVASAFNAGSAKELIKYFNNITEVKINDVGANYSKLQAEPILRDFFKQNPPTGFSYIHKGQSPEGLKYNIGLYNSKSGSFRIVLLLKEIKGVYLIDTINFNED